MFGCVGVFIGIVIALLLFAGPWIKLIRGAKELGVLDPQEMRIYQGTAEDNLHAIQVALMQYHDSEGAFPPAADWMDKISPYLKTADLTEEDSQKKLRNPLVTEANPLGFGFAYNDEVAGKFVSNSDDGQKDPHSVDGGTVLVFDSSDLTKNAHGNPVQLAPNPERGGKNIGVTVGGKVAGLSKLLGR